MDSVNAMDGWMQKGTNMLMEYGPKVLLALLVLWIGSRIIKMIIRMTRKTMASRGLDETLQGFLSNLLGWVLKIMLFISVIQMLGVATTSFIAVLGAAGLAIGLALQGTLANFAGGVLILIFRPYKVGDLIQAQGEFGVVKDIQLFTTILTNSQNKTIIVPNGAMANGNITNFTTAGKIRVDMTIGISYNANIQDARKVLVDVLNADDNILHDPAPKIAVSNLGDSSVDLTVRPWCTPANYWNVHFSTLENAKIALDKAGIGIPYPQRDVHVYRDLEKN